MSVGPSEHVTQFTSLLCTEPPSGLHFTQNKIQSPSHNPQSLTDLLPLTYPVSVIPPPPILFAHSALATLQPPASLVFL